MVRVAGFRLRGTALAGSSVRRLLLAAATATVVIVLGVMHRATVDAGGDSLAAADQGWILLAMLATAAIWFAGTVTQLGSIPVRLPLGRVLAVQVAASFANHLLPAGSGGIAINLRFLRRHGFSSGAAAGAVGLNSLAGLVTHLVLLAGAVAVSPSTAGSIRVPVRWHPSAGAAGSGLWISVAVGVVVLLSGLAVPSRRGSRGRRVADWCAAVRSRTVRELRGLWAVVRDPYRAAALWLGSLLTPLLHGVILYAVLRGLGIGVGAGTAVVVYLVASSLSAVVPSPGGLGALDVTLVVGLAAVGVSSAAAFGAVLGYRLITVWVPLLPAALVFAVLLRRRII